MIHVTEALSTSVWVKSSSLFLYLSGSDNFFLPLESAYRPKQRKPFLFWSDHMGHVKMTSYPCPLNPDKCKEKGNGFE